jgi:hypothetical protein
MTKLLMALAACTFAVSAAALKRRPRPRRRQPKRQSAPAVGTAAANAVPHPERRGRNPQGWRRYSEIGRQIEREEAGQEVQEEAQDPSCGPIPRPKLSDKRTGEGRNTWRPICKIHHASLYNLQGFYFHKKYRSLKTQHTTKGTR